MSPELKQELEARRESLIAQEQQARLEGRMDDAQFLVQEIRKIEKQLFPVGAMSLDLPSIIGGGLVFLGIGGLAAYLTPKVMDALGKLRK